MILSKKHTVESEKINKDFMVIQISDLHYNDAMPSRKLDNIAKNIIEKEPDYVIFCGDAFFDEVKDMSRLYSFFGKIANHTPVYISLGNHDVMMLDKSKGVKYEWAPYDRSREFTVLHNIPGVRVLHNDQLFLKEYNVTLAGVDTDFEHYEKYKENPFDFISSVNTEFSEALPSDTFNEISCHSPKVILNEEYFNHLIISQNADLIHSGHMHNGLVPPFVGFMLPKNRGLIDPYLNMYPNLSRGEVKLGPTTGIIGGPLTTLAESEGLKAKIANTLLPPRMDEIKVKRKVK